MTINRSKLNSIVKQGLGESFAVINGIDLNSNGSKIVVGYESAVNARKMKLHSENAKLKETINSIITYKTDLTTSAERSFMELDDIRNVSSEIVYEKLLKGGYTIKGMSKEQLERLAEEQGRTALGRFFKRLFNDVSTKIYNDVIGSIDWNTLELSINEKTNKKSLDFMLNKILHNNSTLDRAIGAILQIVTLQGVGLMAFFSFDSLYDKVTGFFGKEALKNRYVNVRIVVKLNERFIEIVEDLERQAKEKGDKKNIELFRKVANIMTKILERDKVRVSNLENKLQIAPK